MAKKLISVWLSLTILLFSTIIIYAEDNVQGYFLNRNIDINGNRIVNYYLDSPFFLYQGSTYFPLTEEMGELLGFTAEMDWESRTLKILKKEPVKTQLTEDKLKCNLRNPSAAILDNITVLAIAEKKEKLGLPVILKEEPLTPTELDINGQLEEVKAQVDKEIIKVPELVAEELDLTDLNILQVGDTLYMPFRKLVGDSCFGWDIFYDDYSGLYVSTDQAITAVSYFDKIESDYNRGLASYIKSKNNSVTDGKALMLVFLFKHEAQVYGVDEILLMAMAQKESSFRTDAVGSGSGPVGLMQIMPSTAKRYGIARSQLFNPHVNIEFGAKYIGDKLKHYDSKTIALSAYNQGGGAISRGSYNTRYAGRITAAEGSLTDYLVKNGYGLGEKGEK